MLIWLLLVPAHLCGISSPSETTMDLPLFAVGIIPPINASGLVAYCAGGEIKDFLLYRLKFCVHQCNFSLACVDRLNSPSREDLEIITWICCCCKTLNSRGARRFATAVEDTHPINLLSSLTVTNDFSRSSLHWVIIFFTSSCWRLSVTFCKSANTPRNFKVDECFECWLKTANSEVEISKYLEQLVVPLEKLPLRAYRLDIL